MNVIRQMLLFAAFLIFGAACKTDDPVVPTPPDLESTPCRLTQQIISELDRTEEYSYEYDQSKRLKKVTLIEQEGDWERTSSWEFSYEGDQLMGVEEVVDSISQPRIYTFHYSGTLLDTVFYTDPMVQIQDHPDALVLSYSDDRLVQIQNWMMGEPDNILLNTTDITWSGDNVVKAVTNNGPITFFDVTYEYGNNVAPQTNLHWTLVGLVSSIWRPFDLYKLAANNLIRMTIASGSETNSQFLDYTSFNEYDFPLEATSTDDLGTPGGAWEFFYQCD